MYSEDVPTMKSISISQILVLPDVKVPLKRNFFSRFSIVQNVCNTTVKNILAKKIFLLCVCASKCCVFHLRAANAAHGQKVT